MSTLQKKVIQSLDGLSDENLSFLLEMIQRFMKPVKDDETKITQPMATQKNSRRIGSLEGQNLIDADYDIDECNREISEIFGVFDL